MSNLREDGGDGPPWGRVQTLNNRTTQVIRVCRRASLGGCFPGILLCGSGVILPALLSVFMLLAFNHAVPFLHFVDFCRTSQKRKGMFKTPVLTWERETERENSVTCISPMPGFIKCFNPYSFLCPLLPRQEFSQIFKTDKFKQRSSWIFKRKFGSTVLNIYCMILQWFMIHSNKLLQDTLEHIKDAQ